MKKNYFKEKLYFTEDNILSYSQEFLFTSVIAKAKSIFQEIEIFETPKLGKVLVLDGVIQTTEVDEFFYHEMFAHVPLFSHNNPEQVLIIGGGDGGLLREVLKHNYLTKATMVEIDGKVIELCSNFMPNLSSKAFESNKASILVEDGIAFVKNTNQKFDVILVDSTDPNPSSAVLFTKDFYLNAKNKLNSNGILATQSGVPFFQPQEMVEIYKLLKSVFTYVKFFVVPVPTYVGGFMVLSFATDNKDNLNINIEKLKDRFIKSNITNLKYYNSNIHLSSFELPNYIIKLLQ